MDGHNRNLLVQLWILTAQSWEDSSFVISPSFMKISPEDKLKWSHVDVHFKQCQLRRVSCSKTKQKKLWRGGKPLGNLELKEKSGTEPARTEKG